MQQCLVPIGLLTSDAVKCHIKFTHDKSTPAMWPFIKFLWPLVIISESLSINTTECKRYWNRIFTYSMSVCLSVWKVYCGKMADWIWIPFQVVSGVSRGILVVIVEEEGAVFKAYVGHPIVNNGDFVAYLCEHAWTDWAVVWGGEWSRSMHMDL